MSLRVKFRTLHRRNVAPWDPPGDCISRTLGFACRRPRFKIPTLWYAIVTDVFMNFLSNLHECCDKETWSLLWSIGQSPWLQTQRSGFDSRRYQMFWEVVGLERCPLIFVITTEELLRRKSNSSGLESREYGCRDPSRWLRISLYPQKLALTSPTSDSRAVGIVRSRTQATEFSSLVQIILSMLT
jgi:hypothetical protein